MSTDKRASTVMTSWLLAGLRLCHASSQHQGGTVWLLGVGHAGVLTREQATLLLALLLTQSGQTGMLLRMCLRMRRLTSVGRLLLWLLLLLLLLLNRLHLAGVHLLLLGLWRLARDRQVGLLRWMARRLLLLLLCRTHLV